jgi:hypothetical protein
VSHWLLPLLPEEERDWGEAYVTEFGTGGGLLRVLVTAWELRLKKGDMVRTVVATTSIVNILFGLIAAGLFVWTESPPLVLLLGLGLLLQGGYTLWHVVGHVRRSSWSTHLLIAGQTVALLIGVGAFAIVLVNNLDPPAGDREYGPMAAAGVIAAQAAAALYMYAIRAGRPSRSG